MRRTKSELNVLATKYGWKTRTLTYADLRSMSADEYEWHEANNATNLRAAVNQSPQAKAEMERGAEEKSAKKLWTDGVVEGDTDVGQSRLDGDVFCLRFPQFISNGAEPGSNAYAIAQYLKEHGLLPKFDNYVRAFRDLAIAGKLTLNPSAVGLGTETTMSGRGVAAAIRNRKGWERLLDPAEDVSPEDAERLVRDKMGATEWNEKHPFRDPIVDQTMKARTIDQMRNSVMFFLSQHPEFAKTAQNRDKLITYLDEHDLPLTAGTLDEAARALAGELETTDAVKRSGATTLTDLGGRERYGQRSGYPEPSSKLMAKVNSMTAEEYAKWLKQNPGARRSLDGEKTQPAATIRTISNRFIVERDGAEYLVFNREQAERIAQARTAEEALKIARE